MVSQQEGHLANTHVRLAQVILSQISPHPIQDMLIAGFGLAEAPLEGSRVHTQLFRDVIELNEP